MLLSHDSGWIFVSKHWKFYLFLDNFLFINEDLFFLGRGQANLKKIILFLVLKFFSSYITNRLHAWSNWVSARISAQK